MLIYRKLTFPHGRKSQFSSSSARSRLSLRAPTFLRQRFKSLTEDTRQPCELPDFNIGQQFGEFRLGCSLEPLLSDWQAGGGWMIGRWRRTADTRGQLTAGGNRDCENRRLSSALPFFPACLPFDCLIERTDKQQN